MYSPTTMLDMRSIFAIRIGRGRPVDAEIAFIPETSHRSPVRQELLLDFKNRDPLILLLQDQDLASSTQPTSTDILTFSSEILAFSMKR
ncbi:cytochrome P450 [Sesbania bispinosa]|nr:cytochrome P450 [Sesbania bispinosa]